MTRNEMRAKCIEALKAAILLSIPETWAPMVEEAAIGAIDSLHGIARLCPYEATEEMVAAGVHHRDTTQGGLAETFNVMATAGDLTNAPEADGGL